MDTQRLHKLADHLDHVRPESFSIRVIVASRELCPDFAVLMDGAPHPNPLPSPIWTLKPSERAQFMETLLDELHGRVQTCQTVACAAGHAVGAFPEALTVKEGMVVSKPAPENLHTTSFETMKQFFNLTKDQMRWIFSEHSYPFKKVRILPKHVAERIRRLLICKGDVEKAVRSEPRALVPEHFKLASC